MLVPRLEAGLLYNQSPYRNAKRLCGHRNWSQLAVAWAMEKFHHFLYASHFILETDQKPLEAILSKGLNQGT